MLGLSKAELRDILEAYEFTDAPFGVLSVSDKLNMPKRIYAFKYKGDRTGAKSKFGQDLNFDGWTQIPTESLIGKAEGPEDWQYQKLKFIRIKKKPYFKKVTDDGWAFIGKFDRDYNPPFNGQTLHIYDESGREVTIITREEDAVSEGQIQYLKGEAENNVKYSLGNVQKINIAKDVKILRTSEPKPKGDGWRLFTYDDMMALIGKWESSRMPTRDKFQYANLWIIPYPNIPTQLPEDVGNSYAYIALAGFQNVAEMSEKYFVASKIQLLVDKEEDDDES